MEARSRDSGDQGMRVASLVVGDLRVAALRTKAGLEVLDPKVARRILSSPPLLHVGRASARRFLFSKRPKIDQIDFKQVHSHRFGTDSVR